MSNRSNLLPRFSLRAMGIAIAVIAAGFGALLHPSPFVANLVINVVYIAILTGACLAIGLPQPHRSFWLAFAVTTAGFLLLHMFSYGRYVTNDIFTRQLDDLVDESLPEIVYRGKPNSTTYFARESELQPVLRFQYDAEGKAEAKKYLTVQQVRDLRLAVEDLPHIDNQPTESARSQLVPFLLAFFAGLLGGIIAHIIRQRSIRQPESASTS